MKIVYISKAIIPSRNANSIQVMKMCEAFVKHGHEVTLLAPHSTALCERGVGDIHDLYGVQSCFEVRKLPCPDIKGRDQIYALAVLKQILTIKPDLAYGRFIIGLYYAGMLGYSTIFESHAPIWRTHWLHKAFFKLLTTQKSFIKLVVVSDALKEMYIRQHMVDIKRILVAHDGADEPGSSEKCQFPWEVKAKLHVGYVGSLYKGKGVEVIERIHTKLPDVCFHIVGGLERDISHWKERIRADNVLFHGFIHHKDVSKYLLSFDICVLPNQYEVMGYTKTPVSRNMNIADFTSPLKLFEYMAHKKAIIASDLPVLREVLDETNSILVAPEDTKGWIRAIQRLKDKTVREKLSNRAYEDFSTRYSWFERARKVICD